MTTMERKAFELKRQGISMETIEEDLGHEFIFNKDSFTGEYVGATLWK
jgi:hypothetical protein